MSLIRKNPRGVKPEGRKFVARLRICGVLTILGRFETQAEAIDAVTKAEAVRAPKNQRTSKNGTPAGIAKRETKGGTRYESRLTFERRVHHVGIFLTQEEAVAAQQAYRAHLENPHGVPKPKFTKRSSPTPKEPRAARAPSTASQQRRRFLADRLEMIKRVYKTRILNS